MFTIMFPYFFDTCTNPKSLAFLLKCFYYLFIVLGALYSGASSTKCLCSCLNPSLHRFSELASQCVSGLTRTLNGQRSAKSLPFCKKIKHTKNDRAELDNCKYHNLCLNYIQRQSLVLLVRMHWIMLSRFPSSSMSQRPVCVVSRPYIERGRSPMKLKKIDLGL